MTSKRLNYDHLAATYDQRYMGDRQHQVAQALLALLHDPEDARLLEVGCGTGRWLADFAAARHRAYGLDFSMGMLSRARQRRAPLHLVNGRASSLPFPSASFDLVYCVNAIHHFQHPRRFIGQARRLLRPGAPLAIVGMDPHDHPGQWYVYDYFQGTLQRDLQRFPATHRLIEWMTDFGFRDLTWQPVYRIRNHFLGAQVLQHPFLRKHACSQLALLTDQAYASGLRRIQRAIDQAGARGEQAEFRDQILIGMVTGRLA